MDQRDVNLAKANLLLEAEKQKQVLLLRAKGQRGRGRQIAMTLPGVALVVFALWERQHGKFPIETLALVLGVYFLVLMENQLLKERLDSLIKVFEVHIAEKRSNESE